jgi:hypothetical protein
MWMLEKLDILNMDVDVDGTSKTITNIQKKMDTGVWLQYTKKRKPFEKHSCL